MDDINIIADSERDLRARRCAEKRRDQALTLVKKLMSILIAMQQHEETISIPKLNHQRNLIKDLLTATTEYEVESRHLISLISDEDLKLAESGFLKAEMAETRKCIGNGKDFISQWEEALQNNEFKTPMRNDPRPEPFLDTPSNRFRLATANMNRVQMKRAPAPNLGISRPSPLEKPFKSEPRSAYDRVEFPPSSLCGKSKSQHHASGSKTHFEILKPLVNEVPNVRSHQAEPTCIDSKSNPIDSRSSQIDQSDNLIEMSTPSMRRRCQMTSKLTGKVGAVKGMVSPPNYRGAAPLEPHVFVKHHPTSQQSDKPRVKTEYQNDENHIHQFSEYKSPPPLFRMNYNTGSRDDKPPQQTPRREPSFIDTSYETWEGWDPLKNPDQQPDALGVKFGQLARKYKMAMGFVHGSTKTDRDRLKDQLHQILGQLEDLSLAANHPDESVLNHANEMVLEIVNLFSQCDEAQSNSKTNSTHNVDQIKFKSFDVPRFDNTVRGYISFKGRFDSLIKNNMTEEMALMRLKEECIENQSVAHHLVRGKDSLADAFVALDRQFARPQLVRDAILKDLQQLKKVSHPTDVRGLRSLVSGIIGARDDLKKTNMSHVLGESALSSLMNKLPFQIRVKIDEKLLEMDDLPPTSRTRNTESLNSIDVFIEICERQADIQQAHVLRSEAHGNTATTEYTPRTGSAVSKTRQAPSVSLQGIENSTQSATKGSRYQQRSKETVVSKDKGERNSERQPCIFHPDLRSHQTSSCRQIFILSSIDLEKTVSEKGLCRLCFAKHNTSQCKSTTRFCPEQDCPEPKTHSKLLHVAYMRGKSGKSSSTKHKPVDSNKKSGESTAAVNQASQESTKISADYLKVKPTTGGQRDQLNTQLGVNTLRPCHKAFLKGKDGKTFQVQVLYDVGGDLSQITNEAAIKCSTSPVNTLPNLRINVAGGLQAQDWGESNLYNIPVYDEFGKYVMQLKCCSVNHIGETKAGDVRSVAETFSNEGYDISEMLQPTAGKIDLLIGCNFPNLQPQPVATIGTVTMATTRFGKILYGAHRSFPIQSLTGNEPSQYLQTLVAVQHSLLQSDQYSSDIIDEPELVTEELPSPKPNSDSDDNIRAAAESRTMPNPNEEEDIDEIPAESSNTAQPANREVRVKSCPCVYLQTASLLTKQERDFFDRMVAIDEQAVCVKCRKCVNDPTKEEQRKTELYRNCLTYLPDEKIFVTRMPWTDDYESLPDNKAAAIKRLQSQTRSSMKDQASKVWYVDEFEKLLTKGILVPVTDKADRKWTASGGKTWYVSHFAVLNESSASTPLRVVFDPTLKYKGVLISRYWEAPPNLIPNLPGLILRFREHPVPVCMDVSKAYWSVYLALPESHLHRVVWNRLDPAEPIQVYRMVRNSWGMKPAGSICSIAMLMTAEMCKEDFPNVYDFVKNQLYVDDGTFSVETVDIAVKLAKDTCHVLSLGGFVVKHFIIGGEAVDITGQTARPDDLPQQIRFGGESERILGMIWRPKEDTIGFACRVNFSKKIKGARSGSDLLLEDFDNKFPEPFTQRMYVSQVYSHFDPPGLASPVSIIMRHELGLIFMLGGEWDVPIPHEGTAENLPTSVERCKEIIKLFYDLGHVAFPRCLRPPEVLSESNPVLVIFCDASQMAYGAIAFYNWQTPSGKRLSRIVSAKAKPVPKKAPLLTIPRAEAMGAVTGVHLAQSIMENTTYQITERMFLLDSTIVLGQIGNEPGKFRTWVASRMDEIHRLAKPNEFYYIESELNVADDTTRGLSPHSIGLESRWQIGEAFMQCPIAEWPVKPLSAIAAKIGDEKKLDSLMEVRHRDPRMQLNRTPSCLLSSLSIVSDTEIIPTASSAETEMIKYLIGLEIREMDQSESWTRARRRVARIIHFLHNCAQMYRLNRSRRLRSSSLIQVPDKFSKWSRGKQAKWIESHDKFCPSVCQMQVAEHFWLADAQDKHLSKLVVKSIRKFNPVLGDDGLWRVVGRTCHSDPLPIVPNCTLAISILSHCHSRYHPGSHATLAAAREHYWIINGQVLANSLVYNCVRCRRLKKKSVDVIMAPIKPTQSKRSQVFEHVALDLCGHFFTKSDRRSTRTTPSVSGKVWVLVVVCAASRAVHLEICEGYDTPSFLMAFDTFSDLRGLPASVVADRGSQIVGAKNTLEYLWNSIDPNKVRNHTVGSVSWEFVPSGAHQFLGIAERVVQSFKRTLEAVCHSRQPRLAKVPFSRLLYSVANIINSRPLAISHSRASKFEECRIIRPNDLLLGRSTSEIAPTVDIDLCKPTSACSRSYLRLLEQKEGFLSDFWTKWHQVVFNSLLPRPKWQSSGRPVSVGDLVIVRDTNPVRGVWILGEIVEVIPSVGDGAIRKASVRYKLDSDAGDRRGLSASKIVVKSVRDLCVILTNDERTD